MSNLWRDKDLITKNEKKCLLYFGSIMSEIIDEIDNPHKMLKNKRKYNISDNISCFKLKRDILKFSGIIIEPDNTFLTNIFYDITFLKCSRL